MAGRRLGFFGGLTAIGAGALVLRVAYVLLFRWDSVPFGGDSGYYSSGANLLVKGFGFIEPLAAAGFVHAQSASHPPLYLLYLALPTWLAPSSISSQPVALQHMQILWSCLLGTGSVVLIGLAGREIAGARFGLVAAVLAAIYPGLWVHDGMLLSETTAIFTVSLMILLAYRFLHRPGWLRIILLGLACGVAALSRSELALAVPVIVVPLALLAHTDWRRRVAWAVSGAVGAVLVVTPWVVYNSGRFNEPVTLSTNFGGTLAAANCDAVYYGKFIGFKNYECGHQTFLAARDRDPEAWATFDASQKDKVVRKEATHYIKAHLSRVPVVVAARVGRILGVFHPFQEVQIDKVLYEQQTWLGYLTVWSYFLFAGAAVVGFVLLRRLRVVVWPMLAIVGITIVAVAATFAEFRYRAPAEVPIVIFAAAAVLALVDRFRGTTDAEADVHTDVEPPREDAPVEQPV